jgi:hypothetical protein
MPRHIAVISATALAATALAAAACSTPQAQNTGGPPGPADNGSQAMSRPTAPSASTTLEQVQHWAPHGTRVGPAQLPVTGVDLFVLRDDKPVPPDGYSSGTLVGVVGGVGGAIVEGRELVRAVIDAKADARTLARVALWVARREGEILDAPQNDEQRKARVAPPAVAGGAVVFWVWTTGVGRMLQLGKLDLATAALELGSPPVAQDDRIAAAIAALGGTNPGMQSTAIQTLGAACADASAKQALLGALASHPSEDVRRQVALALKGCGPSAVDALVHAIDHDAGKFVRTQAVRTLGEIGDPRARPALEKAAKSDDYGLAMLAKDALTKLK